MLFCDPRDCSPPDSSVHGIFQEEYWNRLLFPTAGDLPDPGIHPASPVLTGGFLTSEPPGKPIASFGPPQSMVSKNACPEDNLGRPLCYHGKSSGSKDPTCRFRPGVNSCTDQGSTPHFSNTVYLKTTTTTTTHTQNCTQIFSQFLSPK